MERGQRDDSPRKEMTATGLTEKTQLERPADARESLSPGCVFHRVWSGPLPRARTDRNSDTPVDSMASVLDCILRGWFRRCWLKPRLQFPAGLGRRQYRPDVCHLGCHPSPSQNNSWALRGSGPRAPDEWSSLFIAIALWGGSRALASNGQVRG